MMQRLNRCLRCFIVGAAWPLSMPVSADNRPADACSPEPGAYLSATTSSIGQAGATELPGLAAISSGERQLAVGLAPRPALGGCATIGADYEYTRYEFTAINSRDRDLHRLQIPITWRRNSPRHRIAAALTPGIATSSNVMRDFVNHGSSADLYLTARLERQPPLGVWGPLFGLGFDRAFGREKLYPVIGVEYRPTRTTRIRVAYPDTQVAFEPGNRQRIVWRLFPAGQRWHVRTDDFAQSFDYRVEGLRTQVHWQFSITRRWALALTGGYEFERRHAFIDDAGTVIDSAIGNAWTLGLSLRFGDAPLASPHGVGHLR